MRVAVFSTKSYDKEHFNQANSQYGFELEFFDVRLEAKTARLAHHFPVVCLFVNDDADREVLTELAANGTKVIALRCAGYNNVDLVAAKELGLKVVRVPAYSPEAVAEHAVGLMMTLNRRIHKAYQRTRDANFSLEGLVGFNMHGRTAGIIGTGKIGIATLRILKARGDLAENVSSDRVISKELIGKYFSLVKENYMMINSNDIKKYSQNMFQQI